MATIVQSSIVPPPSPGLSVDLHESDLPMLNPTTLVHTLCNPLSILIQMRTRHPLAARHKDWTLLEQLVHILEVQARGLWQESPQEKTISCIANDKDDVVPPTNSGDGDRRDLADHGIEGEGRHTTQGDAFHAHGIAEQLGWDGPGERSET